MAVGSDARALDTADRYADTRLRAFTGARYMLLRHLSVMVLSLGGTTFLLHHFRPSVWGAFAISYLLLVFTDNLISRSVIAALLRSDIAADRETLDSAARLVVYTGLVVAGVLCIFPFAVAPLYDAPGLKVVMAGTAACAVLYTARALPLTLLERELRYGPVALSEIADMAAFYAVAVPATALDAGAFGLALATVARGLASVAVVRGCRSAAWVGRLARARARMFLDFGLPLCAGVLLAIADALVPALVIGRDTAAVGFMVLSSSILGYGVAIVPVIQRVAMPSFARLTGNALAQAVRRTAGLSSFVTASTMIAAGGLAELWIEPLLGATWAGAVPIMQLVAIGCIPLGLVAVYMSTLNATGRSAAVVRTQVGTTLFYVVASVVLVVGMGPTGVAVAFALSRWLWAALLAVTVQRAVPATFGARDALLGVSALAVFGATLLGANASGAIGAIALSAIAIGWSAVHREMLLSLLRMLVSGIRRAVP